ncbi:hypothetical protein IKX64_01360 [Candidatus Saccharibacteria bacterium]|nr:hypothetical protein [Candidatus Saccharibacteria bacterium]
MKKLFQILAVAVAFLSVAAIHNTGAENKAPYIGISPAKAAMELIPGQTYTGSFQVTNPGDVDFDYTVSVKPYKVYGQEYKQDFATKDISNLITDWVSFSSTKGHLEPHTASDPIFYTITVPDEIKVCGQYAAIAATAAPNAASEGSGVTNITSAAMLVYAAVDGCSTNLDGNVRIIENKIPTFLLAPPLTTTSLVENDSNIHIDATYTLQVYSFFTGEEVYSNEENPMTSIIMPETSRFKAQTWENTPILGIYRVRQTIKVYDQESVEEKIVIICPLWLILLVLFAIMMTIFWLRSRAKNRAKKDS